MIYKLFVLYYTMKIKQFQLENNINVNYYQNLNNNITSISIFFNVGSVDENKNEKGMSHFLEHILFKGTKKRKDPKSISKELDAVGAYFNAYTDKDCTCYIIKLNTDHIELALDILSDMLNNSIFEQNNFDQEKNVVVEEITRDKDNTERQIVENAFKIIFEGHNLQYSIGAEEENIRSFTRDNVMKYWKKYYTSDNMIISIVSNNDFEIIKTLLNEYFKKFKNSNVNKLNEKNNLILQKTPKYIIEKKNELEQVHLVLGFTICNRYNQDRFTLDIINVILAGNMSSRLFLSLREENGLSYTVSNHVGYYKDTGGFFICTSFDKDSLILKNINDIDSSLSYDNLYDKIFKQDNKKFGPGGLPIILEELKKLKENLISDNELNKVKGYIKGSLSLQLEDSHNIAEYFGRQLIANQSPILNYDDLLDIYENINIEDIQRISKKYFDFNKLNISIISDHYEKEYIESFINQYLFDI